MTKLQSAVQRMAKQKKEKKRADDAAAPYAAAPRGPGRPRKRERVHPVSGSMAQYAGAATMASVGEATGLRLIALTVLLQMPPGDDPWVKWQSMTDGVVGLRKSRHLLYVSGEPELQRALTAMRALLAELPPSDEPCDLEVRRRAGAAAVLPRTHLPPPPSRRGPRRCAAAPFLPRTRGPCLGSGSRTPPWASARGASGR